MDLIPADYRAWQRMRMYLLRAAVASLATLALAGVAYLYLSSITHGQQQIVAQLEHKKAIGSQRREVLKTLRREKNELQQKLQILERLRQGVVAKDMFVAIDRAIDERELWFNEWTFQRAGAKVRKRQQGVNTGYFIVIPNAQQDKAQAGVWQIRTHMEIKGQAVDHNALSKFVSRLLDQPEIKNVSVLKTRTRHYPQLNVIEFNLAIVVNSKSVGT